MSYVHKPHTKPLEHRTPFQLLHVYAKKHPNKEAFVLRDESRNRTALTFQEYESKSKLLAAAFLEIGLVRGDRVLVMLPTCLEFLLVHMALNRIGANMILIEEDAYPAVLGTTNLACVIARVEMDHPSKNHQKVLEDIQVGLEKHMFKAIVMVSPNAGSLKDHDKVFVYKELFDMAQRKPDCDEVVQRAESLVQMDDPSLVMFTSGSTSMPKPIQYTNFGYVNGSLADASMMLIDENSVYFSDSPFDWISGLCFSIGVVFTTGSTVIAFPPKIAFQGGLANTILKIMEEEACTHAMMLAYLFYDIVTTNEILTMDLSNLKVAITGGQALSTSLIKKVFKLIPHLSVSDCYGATEMNIVARQVVNKDNIDSADFGLMNVVDGMELKIVDEQKMLAPLDCKGEICARSPWVSFPNWDLVSIDGRPSSDGIGKNGWHFSNDGASMDKDGRLKLQGRMDDLIKCGTESIVPYEIEDLLLQNPHVQKVCVVGVPDKRIHEKICACIILKDGINGVNGVNGINGVNGVNGTNGINGIKQYEIENELEKLCSDNCWESPIGLQWKPHFYIFVNEFPLTRTGKLSRRLVRKMAIKKLAL